jgi:hypothetical protein
MVVFGITTLLTHGASVMNPRRDHQKYRDLTMLVQTLSTVCVSCPVFISTPGRHCIVCYTSIESSDSSDKAAWMKCADGMVHYRR